MATVLKLITTSYPWTFVSLGKENEDTGVMEQSKLFPINSVVKIKHGLFPHSYDVNQLIGKQYIIGNICDFKDDKKIEITFVNYFCDMSNIIQKQRNGICNIYVKEINPVVSGGSRSKSQKSRNSRNNKRSKRSKRSTRSNKNKSKKRDSKH